MYRHLFWLRANHKLWYTFIEMPIRFFSLSPKQRCFHNNRLLTCKSPNNSGTCECVFAEQIKPKIPRPAVGRVSLIVPRSHGTKHACDNSWGNYVVSVQRKFPHGATAAAFFPLFSAFVCLSQAEPIRFALASVCARWVMVGGGGGWKIHRYFSSCDAGN